MISDELQRLIAQGESLAVEFKSDRGPLPDADLIETVVCLANASGGALLIGVEDDGTITGLQPQHQTHPGALAAFVASRTMPPLSVEANFVSLPEGVVGVLRVPAARQPTSTSDGRLLIRYWDALNRPGYRPLYAYELTNWLAQRGQADPTALIIPDTSWDDLDPLEFARLRRLVEENPGDATLLRLSDREIAGALGLTRAEGDLLRPTVAGLLLVGKESAIKEHVPAHEVAFQVLRGTDVVINEFRHWPLLRVHEWLMEAAGVRNEEQELMLGSIRVGVPRYDPAGLREAVSNALIHRDYTRLGAVHLQLRNDHIRVSNPGGFVEGVHPDNLLVTEPRPRNPRLADAFKRAGLVERTGRGVETIYRGQLRNGRRPPDYTLSTAASVNLLLDSSLADLDFVQIAVAAGRRLGQALAVDELLALWQANSKDGTTAQRLTPVLQRDVAYAAAILAELTQAGILQAEGAVHYLVANHQLLLNERSDCEANILAHVRQRGRISRQEVVEQCQVSARQATYLLKKLVAEGLLKQQGAGRGTFYTQPETNKPDK